MRYNFFGVYSYSYCLSNRHPSTGFCLQQLFLFAPHHPFLSANYCCNNNNNIINKNNNNSKSNNNIINNNTIIIISSLSSLSTTTTTTTMGGLFCGATLQLRLSRASANVTVDIAKWHFAIRERPLEQITLVH